MKMCYTPTSPADCKPLGDQSLNQKMPHCLASLTPRKCSQRHCPRGLPRCAGAACCPRACFLSLVFPRVIILPARLLHPAVTVTPTLSPALNCTSMHSSSNPNLAPPHSRVRNQSKKYIHACI